MRGKPFGPCRLLGALAAAAIASHAHADRDDTLQFSARHELFYDSNLLRLSPSFKGQVVPGVSTRSDVINTSTLGLHLNKPYSLQRIELDAFALRQEYRNFDYLNYSALNYRAAWHWSLTPRLRGDVSTQRDTHSNSASDVANVTRRNLRRDTWTRLNAEADLGAAVRLLGALSQRRISNEQFVAEDRDSNVRSVFAGLRYVFPSGSSVGYGYRVASGGYLRDADDAPDVRGSKFDQTEHEIAARWNWSGRTSFEGRVAYVNRRHAERPERDFGTPLAELRMRWAPTGKLRLDTLVARTFTATHTDYASYSTRDRIALTPSWAMTAHTSVRLQLEQSEQKFRGAPPDSLYTFDRDDTVRLARLAMDWRPRETITLTVQLQTERRSSTFTGFDYRTHGASLAAQVRF